MDGTCGRERDGLEDFDAEVRTVELDFKGTYWLGVDLIQLADYSGKWQDLMEPLMNHFWILYNEGNFLTS
jgi:hypothetical protein